MNTRFYGHVDESVSSCVAFGKASRFFSWIIIHEDILGMSLLLWKMQSKVFSAYSIVGINALHEKKCWRWSLLWVYQKIQESCRKSHLHPWNYASSLLTLQRSFNGSFPSQSLSVYGDGRRACLWCAEGEFRPLSGSTHPDGA